MFMMMDLKHPQAQALQLYFQTLLTNTLSPMASILTAELYALLKSVEHAL